MLDESIKEIYERDGVRVTFKPTANPCTSPSCIKAPAVDYVGESKSMFFDLMKNGISVLENCCIHNEYCKISPNEKVVRLHGINIRSDLRTKKTLKKIHHKQIEIYKTYGCKRIVLTAKNNGLIVWFRLGFNYDSLLDEQRVFNGFRKYLAEVKDIADVSYRSLKEVPSEYFFDDSENCTDWLMRNGINNLKMTYWINYD